MIYHMCGVGLFGEADINHIICLHHILCAPTQDAVCSKYLTSEPVFFVTIDEILRKQLS